MNTIVLDQKVVDPYSADFSAISAPGPLTGNVSRTGLSGSDDVSLIVGDDRSGVSSSSFVKRMMKHRVSSKQRIRDYNE